MLDFFCLGTYRGAGTGRQAWLRAMCPLGRVGSIPILGTTKDCSEKNGLFCFKEVNPNEKTEKKHRLS